MTNFRRSVIIYHLSSMNYFRQILSSFLQTKRQNMNAAEGSYMVNPMIDLNPQHQRRNGPIQTLPNRQGAPNDRLPQEDYLEMLDLPYEPIRNSQMAETSSVSSQEYTQPTTVPPPHPRRGE